MTNRKLWQLAATHLTPKQWQALCLRYIDDLTFREVGERMGISERAASRHVTNALRIIHQKAKEKEKEAA